MAEIWKHVPSCPGILVSSEGRFVFPPSYAPLRKGGYRSYLPVPQLGVKRRSKKGAAHVYYGIWHKRYGNLKVHRLVCEAFHGPAPFDRAVVIHLDENALNNRPENLKWGTQKENLNMPKFIEYARRRTGENSPARKGMVRKAQERAA